MNEEMGFESYLGKDITLWCVNYIYTGKLIGVNNSCVKLEDAMIVYETGAFNESGWKDAQRLPGDCHYVQISLIESFGDTK
jgi:hypothetical protein